MADLPSNVMDDLDLFTDSFGWDLRSQHYGDGKEIQFIKDTFKSFKAFNRGRAWLFDGKSRRGFKDTDPVYFIYFDSLISGADAFLFHDVQKTYLTVWGKNEHLFTVEKHRFKWWRFLAEVGHNRTSNNRNQL
jgi:hypothetical protein